jgi:hypothetical protein
MMSSDMDYQMANLNDTVTGAHVWISVSSFVLNQADTEAERNRRKVEGPGLQDGLDLN